MQRGCSALRTAPGARRRRSTPRSAPPPSPRSPAPGSNASGGSASPPLSAPRSGRRRAASPPPASTSPAPSAPGTRATRRRAGVDPCRACGDRPQAREPFACGLPSPVQSKSPPQPLELRLLFPAVVDLVVATAPAHRARVAERSASSEAEAALAARVDLGVAVGAACEVPFLRSVHGLPPTRPARGADQRENPPPAA